LHDLGLKVKSVNGVDLIICPGCGQGELAEYSETRGSTWLACTQCEYATYPMHLARMQATDPKTQRVNLPDSLFDCCAAARKGGSSMQRFARAQHLMHKAATRFDAGGLTKEERELLDGLGLGITGGLPKAVAPDKRAAYGICSSQELRPLLGYVLPDNPVGLCVPYYDLPGRLCSITVVVPGQTYRIENILPPRYGAHDGAGFLSLADNSDSPHVYCTANAAEALHLLALGQTHLRHGYRVLLVDKATTIACIQRQQASTITVRIDDNTLRLFCVAAALNAKVVYTQLESRIAYACDGHTYLNLARTAAAPWADALQRAARVEDVRQIDRQHILSVLAQADFTPEGLRQVIEAAPTEKARHEMQCAALLLQEQSHVFQGKVFTERGGRINLQSVEQPAQVLPYLNATIVPSFILRQGKSYYLRGTATVHEKSFAFTRIYNASATAAKQAEWVDALFLDRGHLPVTTPYTRKCPVLSMLVDKYQTKVLTTSENIGWLGDHSAYLFPTSIVVDGAVVPRRDVMDYRVPPFPTRLRDVHFPSEPTVLLDYIVALSAALTYQLTRSLFQTEPVKLFVDTSGLEGTGLFGGIGRAVGMRQYNSHHPRTTPVEIEGSELARLTRDELGFPLYCRKTMSLPPNLMNSPQAAFCPSHRLSVLIGALYPESVGVLNTGATGLKGQANTRYAYTPVHVTALFMAELQLDGFSTLRGLTVNGVYEKLADWLARMGCFGSGGVDNLLGITQLVGGATAKEVLKGFWRLLRVLYKQNLLVLRPPAHGGYTFTEADFDIPAVKLASLNIPWGHVYSAFAETGVFAGPLGERKFSLRRQNVTSAISGGA